MSEGKARLAISQRLGYGVGDFGINLYFISMMTYLAYFYTDVFGLSAAAASGVVMVARTIDAVTDPIMGAIAERTRSRWGRMRPWLLFGALPLAAFAVASFSAPELSPSGKLLWAFVTYTGFGIVYTAVTIPYSALTASLTTDHHERTLLSTVRMACAFAGGLVVSAGLPALVACFPDEAVGYPATMLGFACIATCALLVTFRQTEERVQPPKAEAPSLRASLRAILVNPPLLIVIVLFTFGMLSFTVRQTATPYFFKYNLGRPDLIDTWFLATMSVMFVGLLGTPWLAARFGKAGGMLLGACVSLLAAVGLYFTPYDNLLAIFFWGVLLALGGTPLAVLGWAMLPDTVEFAQWRHGVRADGVIFAAASFFQKLAKSLGGAGVLAALAVVGYVGNAEQSAASLGAIHNLMTLAPAAIMVLVILAARLHALDQRAHERILARIGPQAPDL